MLYQTESPVLTESSSAYTEVEVFKTNVQKVAEAEKILRLLKMYFPDGAFNFDLDDCDKILRAKGKNMLYDASSIMALVASMGYKIDTLPD